MKKALQFSFFKDTNKSFAHGGETSKGKRKERRPIATKKAMHVTMRSSKAKGSLSLLTKTNANIVRVLLKSLSKRFGVRVHRFAINGNHLHLLVQGRDRAGIQNFFRVLTGQIAQKISKSAPGKPLEGRFWDDLVFSRIVEWGRDFINVCKYILQNELEAIGAIAYRPRGTGRAGPKCSS